MGDGLSSPCIFWTRWARRGGGVAGAAFRDADKPRILSTFNEPISDWLSFYMFTYFTDRDGKFQLKSLAESSFDPLSRTCKFMLTEERITCSWATPELAGDQAHR